jgi:hypothetical protein
MRHPRLTWLLAVGLLLAAVGGAVGIYLKYRAATAFFNGQDLTGWEGLGEYWSVKGGAIVGASPHGARFNTFLCSTRKYKDFELKFKVKLMGKGWPGNSGVNIRSAVSNPEKFVVVGPQCDIGQYYWGSLYDERTNEMMAVADAALVKKLLRSKDFNNYYIKCVGKHVTIKLNGVATVDEDFDNLPAEGIIAWQLHAGAPMQVIFKDIEFKDLSDG